MKGREITELGREGKKRQEGNTEAGVRSREGGQWFQLSLRIRRGTGSGRGSW